MTLLADSPRRQDASTRPAVEPSREPSKAFYALCEIYVTAMLVLQFSVFGTFLVGDIAILYPVFIGGAIGVIVLAPKALVLRSKLNIPVLLVASWFVLSVAWTRNPPEWRHAVLRIAVLPVVALIVMRFLPMDRLINLIKRLTLIVIVMVFVGTAISPQTMSYHLDDETGQRSIPGWHGTFDHKNGMMGFLMVGLITFMVFEQNKLHRRVVGLLVISLAILGQSGTGSATLVVVGLAALSLRLRQEASNEKAGLFLIVSTITWILLALVVGLAGPAVVNFFGKDLTFTGRTQIWSASWRAIGQEPWLGYGLGGVWVNQGLQPTADLTRLIGFRVGHAHNGILELLMQVGAIGLALYLSVAVIAVTRLWRARYRAPLTARWGLLICLTMTLLSLSEAMTLHPGYATMLFFMCVVPLDRDRVPSARVN